MKRGRWFVGSCFFGACLLHLGCDEDRPCGEGSNCLELATAGQGGAAAGAPDTLGGERGVTLGGEAGAPGAVSGGSGSALAGADGDGRAGGDGGSVDVNLCDDACLASTAPWIVYQGGPSPTEWQIFAVKSDLIGKMTPIAVGPEHDPKDEILGMGKWSPDRASFFLWTGHLRIQSDADVIDNPATYLIHWGKGQPDPPLSVSQSFCSDVPAWSPSGKSLFCSSYNDIKAQDVGDVGSERVVTTLNNGPVFIKSDDEIVFTHFDSVSAMTDLYLAVRENGEWVTKTIAPQLSMETYWQPKLTPDLSSLVFTTLDQDGNYILWTVETKEGSQPQQLTSAAAEVLWSASPDGQRYLLLLRDATPQSTRVLGGIMPTSANPPVLHAGMSLGVEQCLPGDGATSWAPDSSRAALFQDGPTSNRQLVLYEPDAAQPWQPLPVMQQFGDLTPLWSPDSKELAIVSRTGETSDQILSLVSADGTVRDVATIPRLGKFEALQFSAQSEFFTFRLTTDYLASPPTTKAYSVDLRNGFQGWDNLVPLPGADYDAEPEFSPTGTTLLYEGYFGNSFVLDLASAAPPVPIDPLHRDFGAIFQGRSR